MPDNLKADFAIEVNFAPNTPDPSRVFRSMTALIDSLQHFDKELVQAIDLKIEPVLFLEDIEVGSLRTWLRSVITSVDDSALRDGDWKKVVGSYLLKSKYILINRLDGKTQITNRNDIKEIEGELLAAAEATNIKRIPSYQPMPEGRIIEAIDSVGKALAHLSLNDSAKLITPEGEAKFNLTLKVSPEGLRDLIVKESLTHESVMILKVKRPDYLGEAMWDFKFGDHPLQAKILDFNWLAEFQGRKVDVRPGDAIRARVRHITNYGFDAEVVYEKAEIIEVLEVIPLLTENQPLLLEGQA